METTTLAKIGEKNEIVSTSLNPQTQFLARRFIVHIANIRELSYISI